MRLGLGARAWALGGSYVALSSDATAPYWNPANLMSVHRREVILMHAETFGSLLNYDAASISLPPSLQDQALAFGLAVVRLGGGGIQRTALANPSLPISDTNRVVRVGETVGHGDWAVYGSVARTLKPGLDAGASVKLIYRDLVDVSAFGVGVDLGAAYRWHRWWKAALAIYDATSTLLAYDNGHKESVVPRAVIGAAFTPSWQHVDATLTADVVTEFEGRETAAQFYQGPLSADLRWGAEIVYRSHLALRGGMDADNPTLGVGVRVRNVTVDGAWRSHSVLDDSYRFSLSYSW